MARPTTEDLATAIGSLPAELYNRIRQFTFTIEPERVHIDSRCKPPNILQVDRVSRRDLEVDYYKSTTFVFLDGWQDTELCLAWLSSLTRKARLALRKVRIITGNYIDVPELLVVEGSLDTKRCDGRELCSDSMLRTFVDFWDAGLMSLMHKNPGVIQFTISTDTGETALLDANRKCELFSSNCHRTVTTDMALQFSALWTVSLERTWTPDGTCCQ